MNVLPSSTSSIWIVQSEMILLVHKLRVRGSPSASVSHQMPTSRAEMSPHHLLLPLHIVPALLVFPQSRLSPQGPISPLVDIFARPTSSGWMTKKRATQAAPQAGNAGLCYQIEK